MTTATKLCRGITYYQDFFPHKVTRSLEHLALQDHVTNCIYCISSTRRPMAINLVRCWVAVRASIHKFIQPSKQVVTWEVTWQIKHIISLLQQRLWPFNMARWLLTVSDYDGLNVSHKVTQLSKHVVFEITWQIKKFSTTTVPEVTKVSSVVI